MTSTKSPNFGFLEPNVAEYAIRAERYFLDDSNTALIKLRQFGEQLARNTAARNGLETSYDDFRGTIAILKERRLIPREVRELFDLLRDRGNEAAHDKRVDRQNPTGNRHDAYRGLIAAHKVAIWFHKTFIDPNLEPGPFRPPPNPADAELALKKEIEAHREIAARHQQALAASQDEIEQIKEQQERDSQEYYDKLKAIEAQQQLASQQHEVDRGKYERELCTLRDRAKAKTPEELHSFIDRSRTAARAIGLRGDAAQHVALAQIRLVAPSKSSCHKTTKLLAQSSEGGFVLGFCTKCGRSETVKESEFMKLDLWVSCPKGHGQMKAARVRSNYGFRCETCYWKCYLANLLPTETELRAEIDPIKGGTQ